jgi:phospholipase D1/2
VEQSTMCALRDQALLPVLAADRHRRLRVVYPAASRARNVATFIHSKVMIVDDRLVRIGSANFSRRSMGVDSECDVAAEAANDEQRASIRHIRDRLLGEQLGMAAADVAAEIDRLGSLRALIDARADEDRTLLPIDMSNPAEPPSEIVKAAADPDEAIMLDVTTAFSSMTTSVPPVGRPHRLPRSLRRTWLPALATGVAVGVCAIALIAATRRLRSAEGARSRRTRSRS